MTSFFNNHATNPKVQTEAFEKAGRIHREKLQYMKEAVRLVVLVQVSSAAVERVFSRLRLILETTQEGVLHDAITIRLFEAVNSKYYDI